MSLSLVLVDDSQPFLAAARSLLEREGATVLGVASTSAEALEQVRRQQPDAVLVDVHLGAESGADVVRRLSNDAGSQRSTLIMMSTWSDDDLATLLAEVPAAGFVTKRDLSAAAVEEIRRGALS